MKPNQKIGIELILGTTENVLFSVKNGFQHTGDGPSNLMVYSPKEKSIVPAGCAVIKQNDWAIPNQS